MIMPLPCKPHDSKNPEPVAAACLVAALGSVRHVLAPDPGEWVKSLCQRSTFEA